MEEAKAQRAVRILLVDDEPNVLRALRRVLMDEDYEVLTAESGQRALEILREKEQVGVIVTDQRMPGMTGVEFLEQARKVAPYAMKIILTGYADIHATVDAINKGRAHRYMTKPWDDQELTAVIRSAVETYRMIQENIQRDESLRAENDALKREKAGMEAQLSRLAGELAHVQQRLHASVLVFLQMLEWRAGMDEGHSGTVADLSADLAREAGLGQDEVEKVRVAGLYHDIGKISVPDTVLIKRPEDMNHEELEHYMLHPVRGQRAVDAAEGFDGVGVLIRHHHEHFDGSGFPDHLEGQGIPAGARIIGLADFVTRSVAEDRDRMRWHRALEQVDRRLGTAFDPKLFPALERVLTRRTDRLAPSGGRWVREVYPDELEEGMIVAQDFRTGSGILLLRKGTAIDRGHLDALKQLYRSGAPKRGIFVYAGSEDRV